ncbi:hypothetical protein FE257_000375 [Aspergillus nanangensis]|uniref:G-patch domain protein n=1 Tax=Aspergillus nanangensis TaxID=2582783 RepID=A0AAD4CU64_ASPNN|nr:hypothetical protein FE257_000375 [Aspergillus nanangensis]
MFGIPRARATDPTPAVTTATAVCTTIVPPRDLARLAVLRSSLHSSSFGVEALEAVNFLYSTWQLTNCVVCNHKIMHALLHEGLRRTGGTIIPEVTTIQTHDIAAVTAMAIAHVPHVRPRPGKGDQPTETVIAKIITPRLTTVGAEVIVAVAAPDEEISKELSDGYHIEGLEEVRVIRERQTKVSRQLGFLRFQNLNYSRAFMDQNFPTIFLYGPSAGPSDRGTKVRIAFSREREDRARARAEESGPAGPPGIAAPRVENHGDNDAAPENQPSQFLLFRGLESSVTEELLAKGVAKLYKPASSGDNPSGTQKKGSKVASTTGDSNLGAREGSIRRVLLVRDRRTNESWRYGFAEFATIQDAQAAVARLNSFEKFTISSRPVLVSYIHAGVFVPVVNPSTSTERYTFSPLNNPSLKLMYWDDEAFALEFTVSTADLDGGQAPQKSDKNGQLDNQPKTSKDGDKAKKRKADTATNAGVKKLAVPSQLQFWSNRHAELHGIQKRDAEKAGGDVLDAGGSSLQSAPPAQSYADPNRNCCYLCTRQFKSSAEVNRHERLSELHRGNLQNEELTAKAMGKLIKHGIVPPPPEYRDRARERRKAFGNSKAGSTAKKTAPPPEEEEKPVESTSKGASLLSKMGWSAGSGLGAQGTGMTAPIATEVYAQGVGLGAQGGKLGDATEEAGRNTRGRYEEFLEKTRQTARERYERMEK